MTKLNVAALASIASAPPPPEPKVEGGVSTDTTVVWMPVPGAASYDIRWRRTDANNWEMSRSVPAGQCSAACNVVLPHIRIDDWVFGVSSVSKDGFESPVASAVPGGGFHPYVAPPKKP
jgi:hypothetical protein